MPQGADNEGEEAWVQQRYVVGNWKLNKTCKETLQWLQALEPLNLPDTNPKCVLAPPATALYVAAQAAQHTPLSLAAQALGAEDSGAFTGELSGPLLHEAGARYVLVGHSERRSLFHTTDAHVAAQLAAAARAQLTPILCVGESASARKNNATSEVVRKQLTLNAQAYLGRAAGPLIVAYEPIWAIGTGVAPTPKEAQKVHACLRAALCDLGAPKQIPLLYGGSVTPDNAASFVAEADIDGVLVGGASLVATSFAAIIAAVAAA